MKTPTLPHLELPDVSVPHVSLPHVSIPRLDVHDVTDRAGDAWSVGRDRAIDLASAARDVLEVVPDKAIALAGTLIPALRPAPRRSRRGYVIVAALASVLVLGWFLSKRRAGRDAPVAAPGTTTSTTFSAAS